MFTLKILVIAIMILSASAFKLAPVRIRPGSKSLKMAWGGLQKVGQSVINVNTDSADVPATTPDSIFGRRTSTTGNDERHNGTSDQDQRYEELSRLDLNLRKQALLIGLSSQWSTAESLERISVASSFEGLLPNELKGGVATATMKAGGLTDSWDFDLGN
jgi:hypothetical protein